MAVSEKNSLRTFLTRPRSLGSAVGLYVFFLYAAASIFFFIWIVNPSLDGRTDQHIGADSVTYISIAKSLHEGTASPIVLASLAPFPNNLWVPVFTAYILKSNALIAAVNYLLFLCSVYFFRKSVELSTTAFVALLLLNMTTLISLLTVNKEIIDLFAISLFCYGCKIRRNFIIGAALTIALFNRFEVCAVMALYLIARSKFNPFHERREATLLGLVTAISIALPIFASKAIGARFEEANGGGAIVLLDTLQIHFLYCVAVLPKIFENLFAELINFSKWQSYSLADPANSYILWCNNAANFVVISYLLFMKRLKLRSDSVYLAAIGSTLMALSLVIQPRYFYFVYVLLCVEAARRKPGMTEPADHRASIEAMLHV